MRNGIIMNKENNSGAVEKKDEVVAVAPSSEDVELENELKNLEDSSKPPKVVRTEREKAEFNFRSSAKRVKDLGGDPSKLVAGESPIVEQPSVDTSNFVTKSDLAEQEARKLAKSDSELKLIMWYIKNKGMSVDDAHYMANKNKFKKLVGEVARTNNATPSFGGGAGEPPVEKTDVPKLSPAEETKLRQSGMIYVSEKKAWMGKKIQHRYDEPSKQWVTEKI